jgi:hypothetical protein
VINQNLEQGINVKFCVKLERIASEMHGLLSEVCGTGSRKTLLDCNIPLTYHIWLLVTFGSFQN